MRIFVDILPKRTSIVIYFCIKCKNMAFKVDFLVSKQRKKY